MTINKLTALALFLTTTLGCILWVVGNLMGLPETHSFWNIVTVQIGAGLLVVSNFAIVRLLKS